MKKIIIILTIFFFDRATKIYLINLQADGTDIDFYIYSFLNFYLVWNTGIGFGLASLETNIYYHVLTTIIAIVNIGLIFFLIKSKSIYAYLIALIIGGSLGNLFDRIYYYAAKKALTGAKRNTTDEFLVKKKDPLILPPDYENLPIPDESAATNEYSSTFEKNLEALIEDNSSTSSSVENSILKKIRSK